MKTNVQYLFLSYVKGCIISTLLLTSFISCSDKKEESHTEELATSPVATSPIATSSPSNSTLDELGASFVLALKKNDATTISKFLPTKKDIEDIILTYDGTEKEKKSMLANSAENTKEIKSNTFDAVGGIIKKGKEAGINWEETSFVGIEQKTTTENNTESTNMLIKVSYKNLTYKIRIAECIKTSRGWLIFDKPKWED
ncbi:MAG: hypothetical protein ACYDCN_11960 [Bacteroidia bacterium]